jgi:hypothetical protein
VRWIFSDCGLSVLRCSACSGGGEVARRKQTEGCTMLLELEI